ncbi:MAG: type II toxin-antitoxin system VapC family toxin [Bacteroidota bacterium]
MTKVFIDSDVVLDFLTKRKPFQKEAMRLFEYANRGKLKLYVSSLSINNINYVVSKLESAEKAKRQLMALLELIEILPVGKSTVKKSLFSDFRDFEDGLQNFCAEEANLTTIITRNIKDYSLSSLVIQTPKEFLAGFER